MDTNPLYYAVTMNITLGGVTLRKAPDDYHERGPRAFDHDTWAAFDDSYIYLMAVEVSLKESRLEDGRRPRTWGITVFENADTETEPLPIVENALGLPEDEAVAAASAMFSRYAKDLASVRPGVPDAPQ